MTIREEELEVALRELLNEFEPCDPREMEAYANGALMTVQVTDAVNQILERAERLLMEGQGEAE
jgi:hypothetical protein